MQGEARTIDVAVFGQFKLLVSERLLLRDSVAVRIGGRAFDVLIVLLERAGEVVGKEELIAIAWQGVAVDEGSLRVTITALRKALEDGRDGARFITNVPGRGYCFVAPVERSSAQSNPAQVAAPELQSARLPPQLARMLGRDEHLQTLRRDLAAHRFVSIVGPGGIGKTTVALAVAHQERAVFQDAVSFIDLGPITDPALIPSAIASSLGLVFRSADPIATLINFLQDKKILLVLDSCEHLINDVAVLAERIFDEALSVFLVVTTREVLRVEGEFVHRLDPLECPPSEPLATPQTAMAFPATRLFFERAVASGGALPTSDEDAALAGEICRKLDGVPLAIQLAAGRVGTYGLRQTAQLIDGQLRFLWQGRRTAPPRHQTLRATLDWSYRLLTEEEKTVLRRLSVFVGRFTLDAACAVVADELIPALSVPELLANLVAKSLIAAETSQPDGLLRLLDTTRAYAAAKVTDQAELARVQRQHADYFASLLATRDSRLHSPQQPRDLDQYLPHLPNVRSALVWSFGAVGDERVAVLLAGRAARLLLNLSLLIECCEWAQRGIALLESGPENLEAELDVRASLGQSLMFTRGNTSAPRASLLRALEIAEQLNHLNYQLELLGSLHIFEERMGDFRSSLSFAQRCDAIARETGDPIAIDAAASFVGLCHHLMGNHGQADQFLRDLFARSPEEAPDRLLFGFHFRNRAAITFARHLWLVGKHREAIALAHATTEAATALAHPVTLGIALMWAISVFVWNGDLATAERELERFVSLSNRHGFGPWITAGKGMRAMLAIKRGNVGDALQTLERSMEQLRADKYELLNAEFSGGLVEGALARGDYDLALRRATDAIDLIERQGDRFFLPELLRIKGEVLRAHPHAGAEEAEQCFRASVACAQAQGAASWEARGLMSLARALRSSGRADDAAMLDQEILLRFAWVRPGLDSDPDQPSIDPEGVRLGMPMTVMYSNNL